MPKRSNPWSTETPQQLKTHIGKKELANGVDGENLKKSIYEYTKSVMEEGAKKYYSNENEKENEEMQCDQPTPAHVIKQNDIVAFFNGQKIKPLEVNNNQRNSRVVQANCKTCQSKNVITSCSFCDFKTCETCMLSCYNCHGSFCSLCAIPSYNGRQDTAKCLNCMDH